MVIYVITNKIDGKQYVGQTVQSLNHRWSMHKSKSSGCSALKEAMQSFGIDNFSIEELYVATSLDDLSKAELDFINKFNTLYPNGYNLIAGVKKPLFSQETRNRMSESGKRRRHISASTRSKLSECRKGKLNHNFGKTFSEEHRRKLREARKGKTPNLRSKVK